MKKYLPFCIAILLIVCAACQHELYGEMDVTPSHNPYIGLFYDQSEGLQCFTISSVDNYLDTYFTQKEITHYTMSPDGTWKSNNCEWIKQIAKDFPMENGKVYNLSISYYLGNIYALAAMGEYKNDFYYADSNVLYTVANGSIIDKKEIQIPCYYEDDAIPYAPKLFINEKYICLHTLAGICLLDREGNTMTDKYTVVKIDALMEDIAIAEYNAEYVEVFSLPALTSYGLFKAKDSYVAYPVNQKKFCTFTCDGVFEYDTESKSEALIFFNKDFQISNEDNTIIGGVVSQDKIFYIAICNKNGSFHLYKYFKDA